MPASPETDIFPTGSPRTSSYLKRFGISTVLAHLALCLGTAVMFTLAFPKPGWSFMAYFALVPVGVLVMRTTNLRRLAWTSYLVFVGWWALRTLWLQEVNPLAPVGVALVCGGWFSVTLVGLAAVQRRFRGAMTATLPIFWCAQEALRGRFPWGGFGWFNLSASQANWRAEQSPGLIVQSADLFGELTVTFLVAMTAGLMVDLIARPLSKRSARGRMLPRKTVMVAAVIWGTLMASALLYGRHRIAQTSEFVQAGPTITVVQTNVPQSNKNRSTPEQDEFRLDRMFELSERALRDEAGTSLIIWPETMVPYYINPEWVDDTQNASERWANYWARCVELDAQLQTFASKNQVSMIVGASSFLKGDSAAEDDRKNSAHLYLPSNRYDAYYSKRHLVPFGEHVPGPAWFKSLALKFMPIDQTTGEPIDITLRRGAGTVVFPVPAFRAEGGGLNVVTPICFEDVVGPFCREMVYAPSGDKRADVMVNLTNDGWFAGTSQGYQHLQVATLRCIETRTPMARSVNTGVSGFIDSLGKIGPLVQVEGRHQEVAGIASVRVMIDSRTSPYARTREGLAVGVCAASVLLLIGVWVPHGSDRKAKGKDKGDS